MPDAGERSVNSILERRVRELEKRNNQLGIHQNGGDTNPPVGDAAVTVDAPLDPDLAAVVDKVINRDLSVGDLVRIQIARDSQKTEQATVNVMDGIEAMVEELRVTNATLLSLLQALLATIPAPPDSPAPPAPPAPPAGGDGQVTFGEGT